MLLIADTITVNTTQYTSSQLTGATTTLATNVIYSYYGFPTTNYPSAGGYIVSSTGISSASELGKFPPVQARFDFTGTNCELIMDSFDYLNGVWSENYFTISDGTTNTPYNLVPAMGPGHQYFVQVSFSSNIVHHLTLSVKGNFVGINTTNGNSISTYSLTPKPNLLIMEGDSFTEGFNPNIYVYGYESLWFDGWVWQLAGLVPNTIAVPNGLSSTGFSAGAPTQNYGARVVNDILKLYTNSLASGKYNKIFISASGSINDGGVTNSAALGTNSLALWGLLKSNCPQAYVYAQGNWYGGGGKSAPDSGDLANNMTLSNSASVLGLPYFSPVVANLLNPVTYTNDFYFAPTDSTHPTAKGYALMANWVNTNLANTFGANWSAGGAGTNSPIIGTSVMTGTFSGCTITRTP